MPKLQGKIALVTGGSSGIGLATAKRFVEEGAFVYIAARRQTEMDKAALLIGRNVAAVRGGVSNLADLDRLYTKIASEKGRIDILFGGAGIVDPQPLGETTEESFDKLFATNTRALAFTVKKALPLLNDAGAIIVITSIAENKGILCFTAYSASKAAVRSFVRTWRAELKDRRIRANAISLPWPDRRADLRAAGADRRGSRPSPRPVRRGYLLLGIEAARSAGSVDSAKGN
jgi:NAD(P)-dependent dehydrogenase (short-subunit alcohol dehydrogenase family)